MTNQATASDFLFRSAISLSHKKFFLLKMFDDVIACDLWLAPPPPLIKNPGHAYVSVQPVKQAAIQ